MSHKIIMYDPEKATATALPNEFWHRPSVGPDIEKGEDCAYATIMLTYAAADGDVPYEIGRWDGNRWTVGKGRQSAISASMMIGWHPLPRPLLERQATPDDEIELSAAAAVSSGYEYTTFEYNTARRAAGEAVRLMRERFPSYLSDSAECRTQPH